MLARKLVARGHDVVFCPLMDIRQRRNVVLPTVPLQAVCASSANGLAAEVDWQALLPLPFFAVGPQSADAARQRGFGVVHTAPHGNLQGLAQLIATHATPNAGAVLHLSGADVSGDLGDMLLPAQIRVERCVVYDAVATAPKDITPMMQAADGVLLYSPRAARLWLNAVGEAAQATHLRHFCLSANVAAQLPQSLPQSIAKSPNESGMLELLDRRREAE